MSEAPRRRWQPKSLVGKVFVVACSFLVVFLVAYFAASHFTSKRLADAWRQAEQAGFSKDLNALIGPAVEDHMNAAAALSGAATIAVRFEVGLQPKHNIDDTVAYPRAYLAEFDALLSNEGYERLVADADRREQYATQSKFQHPIESNLDLTTFTNRRAVARSECAIALRLADTDRRPEGARRLVRLLRMTRKWQEKEPFQILALINIAVRGQAINGLNVILRQGGPLPKEVHDEIDAEAARHELIRDAFPWMLKTEALFILDSMENSPLSKLPFGDLLANHGKVQLLQSAMEVHATSKLPYPEADKELRRLMTEATQNRDTFLGEHLEIARNSLLGSTPTTRRAFERLIALARCLRVVNAWSARGDFNIDPSQLGVPQQSLIDPFNEKPLRVKQTPEGPIVHSVAENLVDDGGAVGPPPTDVGLGPVAKQPGSK